MYYTDDETGLGRLHRERIIEPWRKRRKRQIKNSGDWPTKPGPEAPFSELETGTRAYNVMLAALGPDAKITDVIEYGWRGFFRTKLCGYSVLGEIAEAVEHCGLALGPGAPNKLRVYPGTPDTSVICPNCGRGL
jgi:hypothetical protein